MTESGGEAPTRIQIIAPARVFLDGTYNEVSKGGICNFVLMGEPEGDFARASGETMEIRPAPDFAMIGTFDLALAPPFRAGDGVYFLEAGDFSFLLIGRLRCEQENDRFASGDRVRGKVVLKANAGEYLDLLDPDILIPVHNVQVERIQLGTRHSPFLGRHGRRETRLMPSVVWADVDSVRVAEAASLELPPFYALDCLLVSQEWERAGSR